MISSYRLGDLLLVGNPEKLEADILADYPDSIGSMYILMKRNYMKFDKLNSFHKIDVVSNIVCAFISANGDRFPEDIAESTVIHLRLGDVVAGNAWFEKIKRPLAIDELKTLVANDTNKKYVIGKCHFSRVSSGNFETSIDASNQYLQTVLSELSADHFDSENADIDFCCAVKAKLFVQGRGMFSRLIVLVRQKLHLDNIEIHAFTKRE